MLESSNMILSHWHHLLEGIQFSSKEFYSSLEEAIENRNIPGVRMHRVQLREGVSFHYKREYLRITRKLQTFDVCAAPFGNGFFVSWWLMESEGCLANIPFVGFMIRMLKPVTYYQIDTTIMFQESIRLAVLEVIDNITKGKGLRTLSEMERKPIMQTFLKQT